MPSTASPATQPGHRAATRPFIKWAGGKTRLLERLLPFVPDTFDDYYEPFLGGGAMYFATRDRASGSCNLSDLNGELINAWEVVQRQPDQLNEALKPFRENDSKDFYYSVRTNAPTDHVERAAWFLYLNKTSWNGLWRVNQKGEFNVPWGQREFRSLEPDALVAISSGLSDANIDLADFRDVLSKPTAGDFVYLDPPYLPLSPTSKFRFYTQKRFREPDLCELAELTADLTDRGVTWMLSNRDTPQVCELFSHAKIIRLTTRRSVSAQNRRDVESRKAGEIIVVGAP